MNKSNHTPLPWRMHDSLTRVKGKPVFGVLASKHGDFRDKVVSSWVWERADAELIVAAVNSYEKLKHENEALRKLAGRLVEAVIKTVPGPYREGDPVPLVIRLADELKKALEG